MKHFIAIVLVVAAAHTSRQVPTTVLAKPDIEFSESFSQVAGLHELRDGRLIVSDPREIVVHLVDLAAQKAMVVSRAGAGPTDVGWPGRVFGMPGDSIFVADRVNARFLMVSPRGVPVGTRSAGNSLLDARASDARGRLYFAGATLPRTSTGRPVVADSAPLIRADAMGTHQDTIAWLALPKRTVSSTGNGVRTSTRVAGIPFATGDIWTVFPNGRVAIARAADFHIDVVLPTGKRTSGAPFSYALVRITNAEKVEWRTIQRSRQALQTETTDGKVTRSAINAPHLPDPDSWPATKGPFDSDNGIWAAPDGNVWVFHARSSSDRVPVAEVFDIRGQIVSKVVLPTRTRLVGFGAKSAYLVRTDNDDLQYVQRYPVRW